MSEPVGRPLIFKTLEELQIKIDDYFANCDNRIITIHNKEGEDIGLTKAEPYTMSGLALSLGIARQTLIDYENRDEFLDAIKKARQKVEQDVERRLMETNNQTGAIFNLKNNFGWRDKTETDITSGGEKLKTALVEFVGDDGNPENQS